MCRVKEFDLLYDCLTGYGVRDRLRNLKKTDPEFWNELTAASVPEPTNEDQTFEEDNIDGPDTFNFDDDSNLKCDTVIASVTGSHLPEDVSLTADGNLVSVAQAESMEDSIDGESSEPLSDVQPAAEELGPGKRKRRANTLYNSNIFWRHHDHEDPNDEPECSSS
jgi:hypothetical protein